MVAPEIASLASTLAEIAVRNTASAVSSRIQAFRARRDNEAVINELIELVNELISDRAQLVSIAQAFEQELAGQRMSDEEIAYITDKLIPTAQRLAEKTMKDSSEVSEFVDILKGLVSSETMTILQLVGFNFRQAIGQPLTQLVERLILSRVPAAGASNLAELQARREIAFIEMVRDPAAADRFARMTQGSG